MIILKAWEQTINGENYFWRTSDIFTENMQTSLTHVDDVPNSHSEIRSFQIKFCLRKEGNFHIIFLVSYLHYNILLKSCMAYC